MHEIILDRNSPHWSEDEDFNLVFLLAQERYLNDLARLRGYIYLNQIYEALGVCWNPEKENECLKYNENYIFQFQFEVFHKNNGSFRIFILPTKKES